MNQCDGYLTYKPTLKHRLVRWLVGVNRLEPPDGEGYTIRVAECGRFLEWHGIEDPFIRTVIVPSGWRPALLMLLGWYELEVSVSADGHTINRVLALREATTTH